MITLILHGYHNSESEMDLIDIWAISILIKKKQVAFQIMTRISLYLQCRTIQEMSICNVRKSQQTGTTIFYDCR